MKCNWCGKETEGIESGICEHCGRFGKPSKTVVQQRLSASRLKMDIKTSDSRKRCTKGVIWKSQRKNSDSISFRPAFRSNKYIYFKKELILKLLQEDEKTLDKK